MDPWPGTHWSGSIHLGKAGLQQAFPNAHHYWCDSLDKKPTGNPSPNDTRTTRLTLFISLPASPSDRPSASPSLSPCRPSHKRWRASPTPHLLEECNAVLQVPRSIRAETARLSATTKDLVGSWPRGCPAPSRWLPAPAITEYPPTHQTFARAQFCRVST